MTYYDVSRQRAWRRLFDDFLDELDDDLWRDDDPAEETARLPLNLDVAGQADLGRAVEQGVAAHGCDNTLRAAQAWAEARGFDWRSLRAALESHHGYCDCEVLLNVELAE